MKIVVNGDATVFDGVTLNDLLVALGHGKAKVATAVNEAVDAGHGAIPIAGNPC